MQYKQQLTEPVGTVSLAEGSSSSRRETMGASLFVVLLSPENLPSGNIRIVSCYNQRPISCCSLFNRFQFL